MNPELWGAHRNAASGRHRALKYPKRGSQRKRSAQKMKNRQLMGHQRLSMEGKLVYRTSLRKRGWENFIHRRRKLRYTHSPWWGRDCRQILKQECEDSVIWEMKAHILRECNKVCIPLLIWEIVSCILVEGWKPQTQCFRYSSFSLQTLYLRL